MKTKEELNALKEEVKNLNEKLSELTEEELAQVTGGFDTCNKEFIVLVGPSGCGKSTTLRMIAGVEDISSGE